MRDNHADNHSMRNNVSVRDPAWYAVYIDGFDIMTICRYCRNAIEVGHAASCLVCKRKHH